MVMVNGQEVAADGMTISAYLAEQGYAVDRVAVELNGEIVPKVEYESARLSAGDQVEIVAFVGGG